MEEYDKLKGISVVNWGKLSKSCLVHILRVPLFSFRDKDTPFPWDVGRLPLT